jgi:hypothetical protein
MESIFASITVILLQKKITINEWLYFQEVVKSTQLCISLQEKKKKFQYSNQ